MLSRYSRLVLHGTPLLLVAFSTAGLQLAALAGLPGIPLAALLVSWFFKYCFVLLDAAIAGHEEPPVLSMEMVNPLNEQRPLGQAILIGCGVVLTMAAGNRLGGTAAVVLGVLLVLALPASIAQLGLTGNLFLAASPVRWLETVKALRADFLILNAMTLAAAGVGGLLIRSPLPIWIDVATIQLLLIMVFTLIGVILFEHRVDLGLDSRTPGERLAERHRREHEEQRQRAIDHAYAQFRHGKPVDGWREIERWLTNYARTERQISEYHAVLDATSLWEDVRPADKLANHLIALLLSRRATGAALEVVESRFASHPAYRPAHAARLAELARLAGKPALHRRLTYGP